MDASHELLVRDEPSALSTLDGTIRSLNPAMAEMLGERAEHCVGRRVDELFPEGQRATADLLMNHVARMKRPAMRVLEFPGPGPAPVVCLVEARPVQPTDGETLVWLHALDTSNDLSSLLIPFRLAAQAADLGLCSYSPEDGRFEWLGGAPGLTGLFPATGASLSWAVRRVHPDDREAMRRLMRSASDQSPWVRLRVHSEQGDLHHLTCRTRRIQLGHDGRERTFGVIRDDTRTEESRRAMMTALGTERQRADQIASFSSALISATTEQELTQVVLTRLAPTFGGTGALLAFVEEDHLRVTSDAGIPLPLAEAAESLSLDAPSPLPHAIRSGTPQFFSDRDEYVGHWPQGISLPWLGPDFALSITPLAPSADQPLGAWMVTYDKAHRPTVDERALMNTLAHLAGQALKRIRWQQACVDLAEAVQHSMLPTLPGEMQGLEIGARYRCSFAGLDIGGDWYDVFHAPDGAIAVAIGDVQGHDVDAAALMGQIRASMRAIAARAPDPGTALTRTNELLTTMRIPRFASCTMLYVHPHDGRVTGASAGHVPLLCARADGGHDVRTLPGGTVLGVSPNTDYPSETFTLDTDTSLILVTDGVVEGPRLTVEAGLARAGAVAAQAVHDGLGTGETADRLLDVADSVDHQDDVAVLVIRRSR